MKKLSIFLISIIIVVILMQQTSKDKKRDKFVTVKFQGELGNKLFQTAAAVAYAKENNLKLILPKKYLSSKGVRNTLSRLTFEKIKSDNIIKEVGSSYIYTPLPKKINCCLDGFFISEKYFYKYRSEIKNLFRVNKKLQIILQKKHPKIFNHECTVALHIRTFLKDLKGLGQKFYETYPAPDLEYIEKAISYFPNNALFVVCSDNISWSRKFLKGISKNFYFVQGQKNYEDLYLMSLCNHMITSNSTFSWWAAYLNDNPSKKVIVRSPWIMKIDSKIEDIVPKDWIIIQSDNIPKLL